MSGPQGERCGDCYFWSDINHDYGFCNRYPPLSLESTDGDVELSETSYLNRESWCGEFKKREEP